MSPRLGVGRGAGRLRVGCRSVAGFGAVTGTPPEVRFRFLNADGKGPSTMMNIARMYNRGMFLRLLVVTLSLVSTHSTATDESELWTQKSAPLVPSYPNHPPL